MDALSTCAEGLATREADLKALRRELALTLTEQSLEHERLEVLDR